MITENSLFERQAKRRFFGDLQGYREPGGGESIH